ncbi:large conductance mechanosensitive channel protein MscL [Moraxella nasicaprae]|uniref:Large-conductance mechanosensitive channel n=1 Tax=Moraxella nasicaprae TaxID=2904122 RepID=A0ABY6F6G1_9GAMM|nr:large conductance mechanosensitive channel protein MscL [Moraxella nasicaprae]UXZ05691.1 large conductance mechanosensitive channel protein MscL [Moraxella nasicaprae]
MSIVQEFKEFAVKGNVMDLAIGVIIGAAFGKITTSLVEDIMMPLIGAIIGDIDFSNMFIILGTVPEGVDATKYAALKEAGVAMLAYGNFITVVINFLILAIIVFMLVKVMNKMRKTEEAAPAEPSEEVLLLREISSKLSK